MNYCEIFCLPIILRFYISTKFKLIFVKQRVCVCAVLLACVPWRYHFKFRHPSYSVSWSVHVGENVVVLFCFMLISQTCPFAFHVKPVIFLKLSPDLYQFYSVFPQLSACCHIVLNRTCCRKPFHIFISHLKRCIRRLLFEFDDIPYTNCI